MMFAASGAAVFIAARKINNQPKLSGDAGSLGVDRMIPMMGVSGAFVFAAQMINVAIPGTGASGHLTGGVLLAALLGPHRAFLTLASVLLLQCLFFADGGLLAYGCNLMNLGVLACWAAYSFVFAPIVRRGPSVKKIAAASFFASVIGLQAGSFAVVLQTYASGVAGLPLLGFAALMQPIHLAIGLFEGAVTAGLLCFVYKTKPDLLAGVSGGKTPRRLGIWARIIALIVIFVAFGGLTFVASQRPDGLEWSLLGAIGETEPEPPEGSAAHSASEKLTEALSFMPDYELPGGSRLSGPIAVVIGGAALTIAAGIFGYVLRKSKASRIEKSA